MPWPLTHNDGCRLAMLLISRFGGMPAQRTVGLFYDERGNKRRVNIPGEADVQGVLPGGRAVAIEVKIGRDALRGDQERWRDAFTDRGGLYILARWSASADGEATITEALTGAGYETAG